jgi:hypothetical protein
VRLWCVLAVVAIGCARGEEDPGTAKDNCRLRDCGVAVGGQETEPEDEGFPPEDTGSSLKDTGVLVTDTGTPPKDTAPPDTACMPPSGVTCTTFPQCGCASTTNCDVTDVSGKTSCVMAGSRTVHQKCTALGECARGLTCIYNVCMPFCGETPDCAGTALCRNVQYVEGSVTKDIPGMKVCMEGCDPLNPSKLCGASTTCLFSSPTTTTCAAAGLSTTAGSCASDPFTCAPGYVCVNTGDCKRWCRIGFTGDCPGGKACGTLSTNPKIGGIEYGVCAY